MQHRLLKTPSRTHQKLTSGTRHSGVTISMFKLKADSTWNSSLMGSGQDTCKQVKATVKEDSEGAC